MDSFQSYQLIGIGGAHVDRIGHVEGIGIAGASNPGTMREHVGGGMLNALRVAQWRGVGATAIVSVRGGDAAALSVDNAIEEAGLQDLSGHFLDRQTASYTAIHGADGDVITALADMTIYDTCLPRQIRRKPIRQAIAQAGALLVDANMPGNAVQSAIANANSAVYAPVYAPVYAMAISPAKVARLTEALPAIDCLFANRREMAALTGDNKLETAVSRFGLRRAVITNGANPTTIIDKGTIVAHITPQLIKPVDVTGAGDALTGGTIAALVNGASLIDAVRHGMACSACALTIQGPISHAADLVDFNHYYEALNHAI